MDGITRSGKAPLGRPAGKLLTQLPSRLAYSSRALLSMYAHHEAVCTHAVPPPLPHSKLPHSMVVCPLLCQCLQRDVHLRVDLFLLTNLGSMV